MNLSEILERYKGPLNQEQAWAVCHQHAKRYLANRSRENWTTEYPVATDLGSIFVAHSGEISIVGDKLSNSEKELVSSFGLVLFDALEFGNDPNDEKPLAPALEQLIERMTLAYDGMLSEEDDEGYEEDHHESLDHGPCTWKVVAKICEDHLDKPVQANEHYLAVCRALITEAVDLKSFLEKISSTGESLKSFANSNNNNDANESRNEDFPKLNFTEWTHLWVQVVSDLRVGVNLKKVEGYERNVEFELTPYEILMEDIRQRNFILKKVASNGELQQRVKHDAHDIILDFIKSRPTLKPSKNRKLKPALPRPKSIHELLLEQIQEPPSPLRHVGRPKISPGLRSLNMDLDEEYFSYPPISESKSCDFECTKMPSQDPAYSTNRRRIKAPALADFTASTLSTPSDEETDSDEEDSSFAIDSITTDDFTSTTINDDSMTSPFKRHSSKPNSLRSSGTSGVSSGGADEQEATHLEKPGIFTRNTSTVRRKKKLLSVELPPSPVLGGTPDTSFDNAGPLCYMKYSSKGGVRRAQSMAVRSSPNYRTTLEEKRAAWRERRGLNQPKSPPAGNLPLPPPSSSSSPLAKRDRREWGRLPGRTPGIQRTMSDKRAFGPTRLQDRWQYPVECLELTVEELIHIRQVLARADLEKYQGRGDLYTNLKKGKICFSCKVREFSVFWWPRTCQICKQKVCSKCLRKVRTPTDEYLKTPVYSLGPSLNPHSNVDPLPYGIENARYPGERVQFEPKLTVLRERNADEFPAQAPAPKYQMPHTSWGSKGRKMDVCEECCDLISRIIHTNNMTASFSRSQNPNWTQNDSSDLARFVFARPISSADRLKRSTSSAAFMQSYSPHRRGGNAVGKSRSVQSFRAAATVQ